MSSNETNRLKWLCYDIKGIQQFIFSVPKLKYIVGASLLIDKFDQESENMFIPGCEPIFSGGGKGTFRCDTNEAAENLRERLVERAHAVGLDLRIGINGNLSEAARHADDLYPFVPDSLDGEPCSVSGLWPTNEENSKIIAGKKGVHPLVALRAKMVKERNAAQWKNVLDTRVLDAIRGDLPEDLREKNLEFLTAVRADDSMDEDRAVAQVADFALGNRNRWAVLSMDGNDMGCQFRVFDESKSLGEAEKREWMKEMSKALKRTTQNAFYEGLIEAITQWWNIYSEAYEPDETIVLPFRPLIIGGDDILCLCHCSYILEMAKTISDEFAELSEDENNSYREKHSTDLWPGTGGKLSISAGIAFTGVTLPLSLSIPYAEQLLAGAKRKFRRENPKPSDGPTPAGIDWESVTESMIDTPTARRNRDLTFIDKDLDDKKIVLTMRPYKFSPDENDGEEITLEDIEKLKKKLYDYPRSFLTELMTTLTLPWGERVPRLAAMAAQRPEILDSFDDGIKSTGALGSYWFSDDDNSQKTWFLDAISLLEEEKRMEKETI